MSLFVSLFLCFYLNLVYIGKDWIEKIFKAKPVGLRL